MVQVGILGATGYTGLELIKVLLRHPEVEITALTSRQTGSPSISSIHPQLCARLELPVEDLEPASVAERAELVFSCLPHAASADSVAEILDRGRKVVDFSADYRLVDGEVYFQWYGQRHSDPERLGTSVYGLPEVYRERIRDAQLVANPGCFPTSAILALAPLLKAQAIETTGIVIDSKTGVSGAGRNPKLTTHFPECNESISAYNVGRHRHTPEIDQILTDVAQSPVEVIFTPHLVPMDRGILSTCYATPTGGQSEDQLLEILRDYYREHPFVRVVDHLPATKDTVGTNYCDVTARMVRGRVVVFACIDNLMKGASSAAVQNLNLMMGYPETLSL